MGPSGDHGADESLDAPKHKVKGLGLVLLFGGGLPELDDSFVGEFGLVGEVSVESGSLLMV